MTFTEKPLGAFFAESDFRGSFTVNAKYEAIPQVCSELHRHDVSVRALRGEHQGDTRGTSLHAQTTYDTRHGVSIFRRHHPFGEFIMDHPQERQMLSCVG